MATDEAPTAAEVERRVATLLRERLPTSWQVAETVPPAAASLRPDLVIRIEAPDGRPVRLVIEIKQVVERRDVARLTDQARSWATSRDGVQGVPVVAARFLTASVREALTEEGLSYVDATGNMRIVIDSPALFISDRGEDRDPWRKGRPRGTLKGEPAARVARALLDYRREWRVRELITASGASSGATYRVLEYLQREDLVVKNGDRYKATDWERLLREWSAAAALQTTARVMAFIEPRGVDHLLGKVSGASAFPVAVTGSIAAKEWAAYRASQGRIRVRLVDSGGLRAVGTSPQCSRAERPAARTEDSG